MRDGMMLRYIDGLIDGLNDLIIEGFNVGSPGLTEGFKEGILLDFIDGHKDDGPNVDISAGVKVRILIGVLEGKSVGNAVGLDE